MLVALPAPLTDQIVRMRGGICQGNIPHTLWRCHRCCGWDCNTALGKTREGLSLLAKVRCGKGSTRERKMETKPKKIANRFIWPVRGVLWFSPRGTPKSIIEQSKDNSYYTHCTLEAWRGKLIWRQNKWLLGPWSRVAHHLSLF